MNLDPKHDGGSFITPEIKKILDKPGFIGIETQRVPYVFNLNELSTFALACVCGNYDVVKGVVESGTAPDLNTTQTSCLFGFISLAVLGALRLRPSTPGTPMRHLDIISYLIASGASPEIPDISGNTALHHACTPPRAHAEIAKRLLKEGANVNAQNRFGEVPIFFSLQGGDVPLVNILMEHDADLDIADANGDSPREMYTIFGAEVTAAVQRWERKRRGEEAPLEGKWCENCKTKGTGLKQCARCHIVRYCSTECQRSHWKVHKLVCNPFSAATTVTLKPNYGGPLITGVFSRADLTRQALGLATSNTSARRPGLTKNQAENKSMVIKIQVPMGPHTNSPVQSSLGGLFIYNKKRNFVCTVTRASNPAAFDAIVQVVRSRGVGGAKAYFAAELKNPDELVVKVSEVLAEQPF